MAKNPDAITKMMEEQGCTAPRVTKEQIEARIQEVDYQTVEIAGQKMMFCGIKMLGGFVAVGKPAVCISPENWRDEIGQKISYDNSFEELWKLEAYHMTYQSPLPKPKNSFKGFNPVVDNGTVKHIMQACDADRYYTAHSFTDNATERVSIKLEGLGTFNSNLPAIASDFLVIMDDDPTDMYVCPLEVMESKELLTY